MIERLSEEVLLNKWFTKNGDLCFRVWKLTVLCLLEVFLCCVMNQPDNTAFLIDRNQASAVEPGLANFYCKSMQKLHGIERPHCTSNHPKTCIASYLEPSFCLLTLSIVSLVCIDERLGLVAATSSLLLSETF